MNDDKRELGMCKAVREAPDAFSFVRSLSQLSIYLTHEWEREQSLKDRPKTPASQTH